MDLRAMGLALAELQSFTAPSWLQEANVRPSGENTRALTWASWPVDREQLLAGEGVPKSYHLATAGGSQRPTVGRKGEGEELIMIAMDRTHSVAGRGVPERDIPPSSAEAMTDPSGAKATAEHFCKVRNSRMTLPLATFHSRTVRSFDAEARVCPSGLNATLRILSTCPVSVARLRPAAASRGEWPSRHRPTP